MPKFRFDWLEQTPDLLAAMDVPRSEIGVSPRAASVLVPLFLRDGRWQLLFIRRVTSARDRHSGQVAFPGGRQDPEDIDDVATALREAHEEIGLQRRDANVIGLLPDYCTISNYRVKPVVALVPAQYSFQAQPSEVDRIFSIPLDWLADPANLELRQRAVPGGAPEKSVGVVYYNRFDGELLWGATARMTLTFLKALHDGVINLPDKYE